MHSDSSEAALPRAHSSGGITARTYTLVLTKRQISRLVAGSGHRPCLGSLLTGMHALPTLRASGALDDLRLSRSLILGLFVLTAIPNDGSTIDHCELADRIGMNSSTLNVYTRTLVAAGLVARDEGRRKYWRTRSRGTQPSFPHAE